MRRVLLGLCGVLLGASCVHSGEARDDLFELSALVGSSTRRGHEFNVQLPDGRVVGVTAGHVCDGWGNWVPAGRRMKSSRRFDICVLTRSNLPVLKPATAHLLDEVGLWARLISAKGLAPYAKVGRIMFWHKPSFLLASLGCFPGMSGAPLLTVSPGAEPGVVGVVVEQWRDAAYDIDLGSGVVEFTPKVLREMQELANQLGIGR